MIAIPRTLGQWAYALTFCVVVPGALAVWGHVMAGRVELPRVHQPVAGAMLLAGGFGLWGWSVWAFGRYGRGLPMIAFPPEKPIERGPYRWTNHPIYVAFVLACAGVSLLVGSPVGYWIVTPLAALACIALVLGFENERFFARFAGFVRRPLIRLPGGEGNVTWNERLGIFVFVFIPWLVMYESIGHLPVFGAIDSRMEFEKAWPVLTWMEPIYASPYLFVTLVPLLVKSRAILREFALRAIVATYAIHLLYLAIPFLSPPRAFDANGVFGWWLVMERSDHMDGRAAFPAFHVIWTFIGVFAMQRAWARWTPLAWVWGLAVAVSCVATGMHSLADIAAAFCVLPVIAYWRVVYGGLRRWAESVCNSWREWRFGPVRVISYAPVAFLAAAVGMVIFGACAGRELVWPACVVAVCALIGAGLWGRYWVGRATPLRPFGYFGSVIGAGFGIVLARIVWGLDVGAAWRLAAGIAMCAPWVQALGRVRCLVNGCCHGRECDASIGIVCRAPMSRIVRLSGLGGRAIHPTPLYSILGNVAIGLFMLHVWRGHLPAHVAGGYLILQALARFVEEHLRGEPHTPSLGGLRLYQWCAVVALVCGMVVCVLPCFVETPVVEVSWRAVWAALGTGVVYALAMGVDVPGSKRACSRLA